MYMVYNRQKLLKNTARGMRFSPGFSVYLTLVKIYNVYLILAFSKTHNMQLPVRYVQHTKRHPTIWTSFCARCTAVRNAVLLYMRGRRGGRLVVGLGTSQYETAFRKKQQPVCTYSSTSAAAAVHCTLVPGVLLLLYVRTAYCGTSTWWVCVGWWWVEGDQ